MISFLETSSCFLFSISDWDMVPVFDIREIKLLFANSKFTLEIFRYL